VKEIGGSKEIAVVGDGDCGHAAAGGFGGKFADFAGAVEKRVVRVQVQVDKILGSRGHSGKYFKPRRKKELQRTE
jgi:hypothetical protein